jgi:hypothetical protein
MELSVTDRPSAAFILSLIGGIFVLLVGLLLAFVGAVLTFWIFGVGAVIGLWGVLCGIIMIVGSVMMYTRPWQHYTWGIVVLLFSIFSLGATGGLVIGFILGLIGGALSISWRPHAAAPTQPTNLRMCPNCGRFVDPNVKFCPFCGKQLLL